MKFKILISALLVCMVFLISIQIFAEEPIKLIYSRDELESKWRKRIQSFINKGSIPLIDLESRIKRKDGERYIVDFLNVMDKLGIALVAFDTDQVPPSYGTKGYRWGYYSIELSNVYPDRFIPTTNGGVNPNWIKQKGGEKKHYIDQLENHGFPGRTLVYKLWGYWGRSSDSRICPLPKASIPDPRLFAALSSQIS